VVVFNANGFPCLVRTTGPGAAAAGSGASSSSDGVEGTAPPLPQAAPRKKSRLGDIDLSKATILTAQQHAAEQPKHPHKRAKVKLVAPKALTNEDALPVAHLSSPQANALDFLASVAMESNDAPVVEGQDDLVGYKRSFGSISSPPAAESTNSPEVAADAY